MTGSFPRLLAAVSVDSLRPEAVSIGKSLKENLTDVFLVLAAVLALTLVLILWAKYLRKSKSSRSHSRSRPTETAAASPADNAASDDHHPQRRRHRHRRRRRQQEFRERNPTLAETGGLPPPRSEGPSPLSPPP